MVTALNPLKESPQWVGWINFTRKNETKPIKLPLNPHSGKAASVTDPSNWSNYQKAERFAKRRNCNLGYVFTEEDGIVGIDLDDAVNSDGTPKKWALKIINHLNSYTEYSPSGRGFHIFVKGQIPESVKNERIEIYKSERYFTVTFNVYCNPNRIEYRQKEIMSLHKKLKQDRQEDTYGQKALAHAIRNVSSQVSGNRNNTLFSEACGMFELVNSGKLQDYEVVSGLTAAGIATGLSKREIETTIKSARRKIGSSQRYFEKQDEIEKKLDSVTPKLNWAQRNQVRAIIEEIAQKRAWEKYIRNPQRHEAPFSPQAIEHFLIGYRDERIDMSTGFIEREGAYTIPYINQDGDIVNIEYRSYETVGYEYPVSTLYYSLPMEEDLNEPEVAIIAPDSFTSIESYLSYNGLELGNKLTGYWGFPYQDITSDTLDCLDNIDQIIVICGKGQDLSVYKSIKDRAKFVRFPTTLDFAFKHLSHKELKRFLIYAEPLSRLI